MRLEIDASAELRSTASVGLSSRDLTEAGVTIHGTGNGEFSVVGDVIQIALQIEPRRFPEVKSEAAAEADVEIVVTRTVDVVSSGTGQIAEGIGRRVDERAGVDVRVRRRVESRASDSLAPFAIDARRARKCRIVAGHAGSLRRIGITG